MPSYLMDVTSNCKYCQRNSPGNLSKLSAFGLQKTNTVNDTYEMRGYKWLCECNDRSEIHLALSVQENGYRYRRFGKNIPESNTTRQAGMPPIPKIRFQGWNSGNGRHRADAISARPPDMLINFCTTVYPGDGLHDSYDHSLIEYSQPNQHDGESCSSADC